MTRHKMVGDVMTRDVVTVEPTTTFKEIVRLMDGYGISGVPVVDGDNRPVGVVTQADLLVKEAHPEVEPDAPVFELPGHRLERRKATGQVASELMSKPPVTVRAGAGLVEAARRMAEAGVKRLIVVDDKDRLAGIVSREDMLAVFLRPDAEIRAEIVDQVILHEWLMDPIRFVVRVHDGVVSLQGQIERRSLIPLLIRTIRGVDGVVAVDARLGWDWDDTDATHHLTTVTGRTT
jgi:CBS domain-containing protein